MIDTVAMLDNFKGDRRGYNKYGPLRLRKSLVFKDQHVWPVDDLQPDPFESWIGRKNTYVFASILNRQADNPGINGGFGRPPLIVFN